MRRAVFRIRFSARGLGRQFLKSPGNFVVPKSNSQIKRRSRCLTVNEISEVPSQQNSVTSPRYAVTFARNGSLEQSTIGSTKWTSGMGRGRVFVSEKIV